VHGESRPVKATKRGFEMSAATKDDVVNGQPVSGEVAVYTSSAVEEYRPRIVMAPEEAKALDEQLRACMQAILRENVDFGTIPGAGDKKNLLKPGAEKLLQWFGFGSRSIEVKIERDDPDHPSGIADKVRRVGVTYRTEVTKTITGGEIVVATCEGYAGYDEDRYYQEASAAQAKAKSKEEMWARRDGRSPNPNKWQYITDDYRAPWNTVVKMAQKRSYVGAAIDATSAAGLFTQDMEDTGPTAEAAPMASAVSEVGAAAIMNLPVETRKALDRWCREQNLPSRSEWNTAQWCAALVQAGRSAMEQEFAVRDFEDARAAPEDGDNWVAKATEQAASLTSKDAGRMLYQQAVARERAGEITKAQKDGICGLITAQMEDLDQGAQPVQGTASAPDGDPWQGDIDAMSTREDAIPLLNKLERSRGGTVDERRYKALKAAIRTKAEALTSAPGEGA
jgi:hypothetical protein